MKSVNNILNASNTKMNPDGTFTVYFGSKEQCGDVANRLDVPEGWNFLMRVYRPGPSVLDGTYKLPEAKPCGESRARSASRNTTPADFGVSDYAYRVSETDFNIKRSLAKAPINQWAHQDDVSYVKTQQVIRENQDVVYSSAVVDISQGATLSLPKSETYHIIQIIDMQNYEVDVVYPGKSITVKPDNVTFGNYVYLNMRIRKLPDDKGGTEATLKLQRMAKNLGKLRRRLQNARLRRRHGHAVEDSRGDDRRREAGQVEGRVRGRWNALHDRPAISTLCNGVWLGRVEYRARGLPGDPE